MFPEFWGTFAGVPMLRVVVYESIYLGSLFMEMPMYFKVHPEPMHSFATHPRRVTRVPSAHYQWMQGDDLRYFTKVVFRA